MIKRPIDRLLRGAFLCGLAASTLMAAPSITPPKDILGFNIGDDYHMASYTQISTLMKKWESESDRLKVVSIGTTEEGRTQYMGIITSPENHAKLDHYKSISRRLSLAEGLTDEQAKALADEGKAVVWIDGGLHATETVNAQSLAEMIYQMCSLDDAETHRFLNDVILLMPIPNPDGVELVANWYMREEDPEKRSLSFLPVLYHKYIGHDNNRDSIMNNMKETINQNRVLFIEWNPQIMHNVHQTGPLGQVIFIPPFRDPFNYNFDPLIPIGIERVGAAMHARLLSKGMGGSAMRSNAPYSTWWNGGMRTAVYFHNQIGLLTEIIGNPTPGPVPLVPEKHLPNSEAPLAVKPQMWHYRQSIDYMIEVERAVLDYASRNREQLLFDIYTMGKRSIEKGNEDSWTVTPHRIEKLKVEGARLLEELEKSGKNNMSEEMRMRVSWMGRNPTVPAELYEEVLEAPDDRDARGYIISKDQADFPTAVKFVNVLLKQGIYVDQATADFEVAGKTYPAGSYVVKANQAFRPAIRDMFEPQDHPIDLEYPGGPPMRPYDIAGWTPVVQMGVAFDRVFEGFDGPFERVSFDLQKPAPAEVFGPASPAGYLVSHKINDAVILTNRLMKAGAEVYWLKDERTVDGVELGTGTLWIPATATSTPIVQTAAAELGVAAYGVSSAPTGEAMKLKPIRIGLVDLYGGVMPSGWLRWMFEQYEFPYEVIFPQVLDAGNLHAAFDVIVVPSNTYSEGSRGGRGRRQPEPDAIPEEYRSMLGTMTQSESIPPLKTFVAEGGTLLAIGSSSIIGESMGLPVSDFLTEWNAKGERVKLDSKKFYVPGSILRAKFDNTQPLAYGMPKDGFVFFDSSPVFHRKDDETIHADKVAWFDGTDLLYSGWAMGQHYLDGGEIATSAKMGKGDLVLISIEATFRATPHGTFKLFFNGLYQGQAEDVTL